MSIFCSHILNKDYFQSCFRFNSSIPEKFTVEILGNTSTGKCLVQVDQLDRRDGVYIVRYKIFKMCWNVEINVMHKSKHAAKSPYRISGTIYSEKCRCPRPINEWLHNFKCNRSYDQIDSDLTPFNNINFTNIRPKMLAAFDSPGSISVCDYKIKDNNIFRKCYGQHTGFKMFVDSVLTTLVRIVELPDLEFIVNLGDYPLGKNSRTRDFPVFSWCGSDDAVDIVLPTYDITESSIEGMSRVSIDILSIQNARTSWSEKEPKAFWRGRDSRRERLHLIDIARKNPNLLNASLTNFFFFRNEESTYGPKSTHVSLFDFFNYKYQINVDGTVAAYRFPYLLSSNSLVFKQESRFYEHFYKQLSPMHHYIPIKRDLSNLVDQILWAKKNDQKAQKIAQNGQQFANEHLTSDKIFCYYVTLLKVKLNL